MRKMTKKLALQKETLRQLDKDDLAGAAGGTFGSYVMISVVVPPPRVTQGCQPTDGCMPGGNWGSGGGW